MNSLRIALLSTFIIFFVGIFAAYYIAKAPRMLKGVLDVILTLPLVLPPTVVGYLLQMVSGDVRYKAYNDMVVCNLCHHCRNLSADVPHGEGSFRGI